MVSSNNINKVEEPVIEIPCVALKDIMNGDSAAESGLKMGFKMGCFWVDLGKPGTKTSTNEAVVPLGNPDLWNEFNNTMDTASSSPRWNPHRFTEENDDEYLEALMHSSLDCGIHYFHREHFETIATMEDFAESDPCYQDIHPSVRQAGKIMGETGEAVFSAVESILGLTEKDEGFLVGNRRKNVLSLHRVYPNEGAQRAADPHFDFSSCNILLYNYVDGFKVYWDKQWFKLAEPKHSNMLLFNLGSVLSVKTNRRLSALFHKVDTPRDTSLPARLSLVCVLGPKTLDRVFTHPKFVTPESPLLFTSHCYLEHIFYAGENYLKLSQHVTFDDNYNGMKITFGSAVKAAFKVKAKRTQAVIDKYLGFLSKKRRQDICEEKDEEQQPRKAYETIPNRALK